MRKIKTARRFLRLHQRGRGRRPAGGECGAACRPISSTSLNLILHPRFGGRASAAVLANSVWSLFGIGFGPAAINLAAVRLGAPVALAAALAISIAWNLTV